MSWFKTIHSLFLSVTLLLWQTGQCFEASPLKDEQTKVAFESTSKQLTALSSAQELTALLKKSLSPEDLAWLQTQKEFQEFHQTAKVTMKDDSLVLKTKNQKDITISLINKASLTFKINGKVWQYRPLLSLEKNMDNLNELLNEDNVSTTLFNKTLNLFIPEAQAVGIFAIIGIGVVVVVATTALCSMVVRGPDALACLLIPIAPVYAVGKLIDLATSMKKTVEELGHKTLIFKDLQCNVTKKNEVQTAKLVFDHGSMLVDLKNKKACKVIFDLTDPKVKNTPYQYQADCEEDGTTKFSAGQKEPPKEYNASMMDNLLQTSSVVELCRNPEKKRAFLEQVGSMTKVTTGPEVSEEKIKAVEEVRIKKPMGVKTKTK